MARLHRSRKGKLAGVQRGGSAPYSKQLAHLLVEEAMAWAIGLNPFAIDDELRDGTLAHVLDQLFCGSRSGLDIDLGIGDLVFVEESFGFAAIAAPCSGIDQHMHFLIIPWGKERGERNSDQNSFGVE
jgi:hypothetical protein